MRRILYWDLPCNQRPHRIKHMIIIIFEAASWLGGHSKAKKTQL